MANKTTMFEYIILCASLKIGEEIRKMRDGGRDYTTANEAYEICRQLLCKQDNLYALFNPINWPGND